MRDAVLYLHGQGGSAAESGHYAALFPDHEMIGLDYQSVTPWQAGEEIRAAVTALKEEFESVILIANSIGAFFAMNAGIDAMLQRAYFISPIVDMERIIRDRMRRAEVSEEELRSKGVMRTDCGEELSWEYLSYVRRPVVWTAPTAILCGSRDELTPLAAVIDFAKGHNAALTVMEGGEHWFHTEAQMRFLDEWILRDRTEGR